MFSLAVIHVEDAEDHFRTDEFLDATASRRPVIYISPNDIYSTHSIIADHVDVIVRPLFTALLVDLSRSLAHFSLSRRLLILMILCAPLSSSWVVLHRLVPPNSVMLVPRRSPCLSSPASEPKKVRRDLGLVLSSPLTTSYLYSQTPTPRTRLSSTKRNVVCSPSSRSTTVPISKPFSLASSRMRMRRLGIASCGRSKRRSGVRLDDHDRLLVVSSRMI